MRRFALSILFLSMVTLAGGYASAFLPGGPPKFIAWVFALATASSMIAVMMLGAARKGVRLGALNLVFAFCFICVAGGFALALLAPAVTTNGTLWLGLPQGAAVILFVVGFLPMVILPIAYALTFDRVTMNTEELDGLRARLAELREERAP